MSHADFLWYMVAMQHPESNYHLDLLDPLVNQMTAAGPWTYVACSGLDGSLQTHYESSNRSLVDGQQRLHLHWGRFFTGYRNSISYWQQLTASFATTTAQSVLPFTGSTVFGSLAVGINARTNLDCLKIACSIYLRVAVLQTSWIRGDGPCSSRVEAADDAGRPFSSSYPMVRW